MFLIPLQAAGTCVHGQAQALQQGEHKGWQRPENLWSNSGNLAVINILSMYCSVPIFSSLRDAAEFNYFYI